MLGKIDINRPATWFLIVLFGLFAVQILLQMNQFMVPDSDFFDYAEKAASLKKMVWPDNFKRPPLYPLLIAFISVLIPGKFAELYAAEAIGAVCALFSLWLLWRISRRFARSSAPWVVWIWAFHVATVRMTIKPKPEMLLTCLVLWAFERHLRGDRRAYLIAFLATLVRYEGALAIAAFFIADFVFSHNRKRAFLLAALASSFIVFWSLFQGSGAPGSNYGDYFAGYSLNWSFVYMMGAELLNFLPVAWFKLWAPLAVFFFGWGLIALWRHDPAGTTPFAVFLGGFIALHVIWPFSGPDYLVMAAWVMLLFIVQGIVQCYNWGKILVRKAGLPNFCRKTIWFCLGMALLVLSGMLTQLILKRFPFPQYQPSWLWTAVMILPLLFYLWPRRNRALPGFVLITSLLLFLAFHLQSRLRSDLFELYYAKAEFRLVGEWFQSEYQTGDRLLVSQPNIAAYYSGLNAQRDFVGLADVPALLPNGLPAWLRSQNIGYVAWLKYNLMSEENTAWADWVNKNRRLDAISFLQEGRDMPGYIFIKRVEAGPRYALIYRIDRIGQTK